MPTPATLDQPVTFDSRLCDDTCMQLQDTDGNFCFQLPLFEDTGTNLLSVTEVDLVEVFDNGTDYNRIVDTTTVACGTPSTGATAINFSGFPTATQLIDDTIGIGQWFWEFTFGPVTIDYGLNPDDDTVGELLLQISPSDTPPPGGASDDYAFTSAESGETVLVVGTNTWNPNSFAPVGGTAEMDAFIGYKTECDDTNERYKFDITQDRFRAYPAFYQTTFTASDDTFYRLQFKLSKTSSVTVEVEDSGGTTIIEDGFTGPIYDKIFMTGTLPSATVTVKFRFDDLTEWPNADFNNDVLTEVSVKEMCTWGVWVETTAEVFDSTLVQTHDTTSASVTGDIYNKNIQYCIDLSTLSEGNYQFRALNDCDLNEFYISNPFSVCSTNCSDHEKISWDHSNIKFTGDYCLDYTNYTYTPFFRAKVDLQDLTQEYETVHYKDGAGFLQQPYSFYRDVQIMQISGLPGFMRRAVALALTDVFLIDGVEYKKLDDEDISPLFPATDPNVIRVTVTKTGDFLESKNI